MLAFLERSCIMFTMNRMPIAKRAQILGLLVEGMSLRAASRLADCSINTVTKLLIDVGTAWSEYQDAALRNLPCKQIQCDEIWSFCYSKQRNVPEAEERRVRRWRRLDVDGHLRRYQAHRFLDGRRSRRRSSATSSCRT